MVVKRHSLICSLIMSAGGLKLPPGGRLGKGRVGIRRRKLERDCWDLELGMDSFQSIQMKLKGMVAGLYREVHQTLLV